MGPYESEVFDQMQVFEGGDSEQKQGREVTKKI